MRLIAPDYVSPSRIRASKTSRQYDEQGRRIVWALPKALYGGRASGRHWYFTLRKQLLADGFVVSEWDPCLFIKTDKDGNFHYIGVYVDDLIHVYSDETAYQATVDKFAKVFHGYTDLGPLTEIFNAEVAATEQSITLTQTRYIDELVKKFLGAEDIVKVYTPAESDLLKWVTEAAELEPLSAEEHALYREIVGAILYIATVCRPDVAVAVGLLSRALEHPTAKCLEAARRVLHYLAALDTQGPLAASVLTAVTALLPYPQAAIQTRPPATSAPLSSVLPSTSTTDPHQTASATELVAICSVFCRILIFSTFHFTS